MATHYEGDPTDNAKAFHKWLKTTSKTATDKPLAKLKYSVMGLGDTSYEQFNEMAIFCDQCMTKLGGERIYQIGAANAEHYTTEDDFQKWKQPLWQILTEHFGKDQTDAQKAESLKQKEAKTKAASSQAKGDPDATPLKVVFGDSLSVDTSLQAEYSLNMRNYNKSVECEISSIKEIRQKPFDGNSTLEVLFEIGDKLTYTTAGNLAIYPENSPEHVEKFAKRAGLSLDARFVL